MTSGTQTPIAPRIDLLTLVGAAVVAFGTVALALPGVLAQLTLGPDATGYVATAHNLVQGRGLLDPILYSYFLDGAHPPLAAVVIRPPMISLLFAAPLAAGADLVTLSALHVVLAGLVAGSGVLLARRTLSLPAALAFGIAVGWSGAYLHQAQQLTTEILSVAALFGLWAVGRRGLTSVPGALLLAVATLFAWLVRPNLALVAVALVLAQLLTLGPRRALSSASLWTYVVGFALLQRVFVMVAEASLGFAPYEHYGLMWQLLDPADAPRYEVAYPGLLAFFGENRSAIGDRLGQNLAAGFEYLFVRPAFLHVGWLALPALVWAFVGKRTGVFERRLVALSALLLGALSLVVYCGFDVVRYMLQALVAVWFVTVAALDDLGRKAAGRTSVGFGKLAGWLPLLVVLTLFVSGAPAAVGRARAAWASYTTHGTRLGNPRVDAMASAFRIHLDPDAVVASPDPWRLYLRCGNAGLWLPPDLSGPEQLACYLEAEQPGYVINTDGGRSALFESSPRLMRLAHHGTAVLYEVTDPAPGSCPWSAAPALLDRSHPTDGFALATALDAPAPVTGTGASCR